MLLLSLSFLLYTKFTTRRFQDIDFDEENEDDMKAIRVEDTIPARLMDQSNPDPILMSSRPIALKTAMKLVDLAIPIFWVPL